MLPAFICASAIDKFWTICLGVDIFNCVATSEEHPSTCIDCNENIPLLKALRVNYGPS